MAHHLSAKKRIRQTERRTDVNRRRVSAIRTSIRQVEEAIDAGNQDNAVKALRLAESNMARGSAAGVLKRNTASRKVSRLAARVKAMGA